MARFLTRSAAANGAGELSAPLTAEKLHVAREQRVRRSAAKAVSLLRIAIGLLERADAIDCDGRPRLRASTLFPLLA
jgi:hypothetical protein